MGRRNATQPSDTDNDGRYDPTRDPDSDYYIDRGNVSDTSSQVQQNAEHTADQQEDGDGWLMQIINRFTREGRVDTAYNQELSQQAADLANGVNTRQPPTIAPANYLSNPHPELKRMVTDDVDPATVGEMGDTWIEAGNAMTRFQSGVASAINSSEADWEGQAGNSARTFMANVGNWVGNAGQSAQLAGTQTNIQASALAEAKRAMPEPVEFDIAAANRDLMSTTNPLEAARKYSTYMVQYNAQQSAHEQAARVVTTFDSSLAGASTMPAFNTPPQMNGGDGSLTKISGEQLRNAGVDGGVNPSGTGGTGGSGGIGDIGGGTGGIPGGTGGGGGGGTGSGGGGGTGSGGGPGGTGGGFVPGGIPGGTGGGVGGGGIPLPGGGSTGTGGGTDPSGGEGFPGGIPGPGGTGPGGLGPGGVPIPGGTGPGGGNANFPGGLPLPIGGAGVPGGGDFDRTGGRFGSGGFGTPGSGGAGGTGGFNSGAGGAGGSGGSSVRGGGIPPGGFGAGGSALAAESAALRGGGGVAGGVGRGGVGGMGAFPGGGRGQGDEDDEHQRPSFLVEGDPDAVFGTDESTAPPVIGE